MMNEAHSGSTRCIRTRQIGQQILPVAHKAGVRHLAMEALFPEFAEKCNNTRRVMEGDFGYLSQPEMKNFIQAALDLGWALVPYEAEVFKWLTIKLGIDFSNSDPNEKFRRLQEFQSEFTALEYTNWREEQQALNLIESLQTLPVGTLLLVWCGNNHHSKTADPDWLPMGYQFQQHSQIAPFVIDQTWSVKFESRDNQLATELVIQVFDELMRHDGTAGFLTEEVPTSLSHFSFGELGNDAFLISTQNELE
jgi:hypothetical protein